MDFPSRFRGVEYLVDDLRRPGAGARLVWTVQARRWRPRLASRPLNFEPQPAPDGDCGRSTAGIDWIGSVRTAVPDGRPNR